jgi:tagaturonate reductase
MRFVDDLTPYRASKVHILNGSHTMLAAIGRLLGLRTVREAIDDPQLGAFVESVIFQEVIPAIGIDDESESVHYAREILERFRNPFIEHSLVSICTNCSTKAGTRLFPAIRGFMERRGVVSSKAFVRSGSRDASTARFYRGGYASRVDSGDVGAS